MEFKRSIGFWGMVFAAISGMLGSGWLFSTYYTAQGAGPASLVSWILGGIATLFIALTFAELTSMFPVVGSQARFMEFSHGTLTSFMFSFVMWLGYAAVAPVETMGILQYISNAFPSLIAHRGGVAVLSAIGYGWAVVILLFMCIMNFLSVKWVVRYNNMLVWLKLLMPLILVVVLLIAAFNIQNLTQHGFMPMGINGIGVSLSSGGVIFSFMGFATAIVLAGEAKNAQKAIPRVLIISILICTVVYFLLQLSFLGALAPTSLAHGWHNLSFKADTSPYIGIVDQLHFNKLHYLVLLTAIVAPLGTAIIFITSTARVAYAMSQNNYFPKVLQRLNRKGVPVYAVGLNFILGLILFLPSPGWQGMMNFLVAAFVLAYGIGPLALLALRKQLPDQPRRYKLPAAKLWCAVAFFITNVIIYWSGLQAYLEMIAFLIIGLVVFMILHRVNPTFKQVALDTKHSIWVFIYLILMLLISYLGNFGGKDKLPDNLDLALIFIVSILVLYLAYTNVLPRNKVQAYVKEN